MKDTMSDAGSSDLIEDDNDSYYASSEKRSVASAAPHSDGSLDEEKGLKSSSIVKIKKCDYGVSWSP
jgi:hypothetical protein